MDCSARERARFASAVGGIAQRPGTRGDRLRVPRSRVSKNVSKFAAKPLQSNTGQGFQLAMRLPLPHQLPVSGGPAQSGASPELRIPAGFFVSGCLTRSSRSKVDVGASLGASPMSTDAALRRLRPAQTPSAYGVQGLWIEVSPMERSACDSSTALLDLGSAWCPVCIPKHEQDLMARCSWSESGVARCHEVHGRQSHFSLTE